MATKKKERCHGRLFLENIGGLLVKREDGLIHGYYEECRRPITFKSGKAARHFCKRTK